MEPSHRSHALFHEYHSNESSNPDTVLFHALGAWRTAPAFHDVLWSPAFLVAASQLLDGAVRFWHDQLFCKPAHHGGARNSSKVPNLRVGQPGTGSRRSGHLV